MMGTKTEYMRLLLCVSAVFISSCAVHEFPDVPEGKGTAELYLDFDVDMPLHQVVNYATRAIVEDYDARYTIQIYKADEQRNIGRDIHSRLVVTKNDISKLDHSIDIPLEKGVYRFVVWADYVKAGTQDHWFYNTDSFEEIVLYGETHSGNTHFRDAFCGVQEAVISADESQEVRVTMERPLARYNFISTDLDRFVTRVLQLRAEKAAATTGLLGGVAPEAHPDTKAVDMSDFRVVFHYTGFMPSSFNIFTNKPADAVTGITFDGSVSQISDTEAELGFDYVFVNGIESSVQVAVRIYDEDGELIAGINPIDVPIVRSKYTTVRGDFLTSEASGNIGIDPGFDGEWNYPEIK